MENQTALTFWRSFAYYWLIYVQRGKLTINSELSSIWHVATVIHQKIWCVAVIVSSTTEGYIREKKRAVACGVGARRIDFNQVPFRNWQFVLEPDHVRRRHTFRETGEVARTPRSAYHINRTLHDPGKHYSEEKKSTKLHVSICNIPNN